MRVLGQGLPPGMEDRGDAEMAQISGDRDERLGGGAEQDGVDGGLVVEGDLSDRRR